MHPDQAIVKIPILAAAEMQPEIDDQQPRYSFRTWPLHRRILCLLASRDQSCEHHNAPYSEQATTRTDNTQEKG